MDIIDIIEETVNGEFVSVRSYFPSGFDQKLFFSRIHDLFLQITGLVFRGKMGIRDDQEVTFIVRYPFLLARFRLTS